MLDELCQTVQAACTVPFLWCTGPCRLHSYAVYRVAEISDMTERSGPLAIVTYPKTLNLKPVSIITQLVDKRQTNIVSAGPSFSSCQLRDDGCYAMRHAVCLFSLLVLTAPTL